VIACENSGNFHLYASLKIFHEIKDSKMKDFCLVGNKIVPATSLPNPFKQRGFKDWKNVA
jgi:hypothetical protein